MEKKSIKLMYNTGSLLHLMPIPACIVSVSRKENGSYWSYHWIPAPPDAYTGVYRFGESEGEWELLVIPLDSLWILQAHSHTWGHSDTHSDTWLKRIHSFPSLPFNLNRFSAGSLSGFFATYQEEDVHTGIVLTGDPVNNEASPDSALFGYRSMVTTLENFFPGDYPELSYRVVNEGYFDGRKKDELPLMRNEIFARYGMRFRKGGKIYAHFIQQAWYQPCSDDVSAYLTEIEKRNIAQILQQEKNISGEKE